MANKNEAAFVSVAASILQEITYVPLDSRFSDERLKQIILHSRLEVIIVDAKNFSKAKRIIKITGINIPIIVFDNIEISNKDITISNTFTCAKDKICYLLFTSGSTGIPKGVPISNNNLCTFLNHANKYFKIYCLET